MLSRVKNMFRFALDMTTLPVYHLQIGTDSNRFLFLEVGLEPIPICGE